LAKVFLSYDREDLATAKTVAAYLEAAGHAVWWDRNIRGGAQYSQEIERALEDSDAVVVLWSKASVNSEWVRDEAAEGRDRGTLVPVLIEPVKPPMGFRQFQTIDVSDWSDRAPSERARTLLEALADEGSPMVRAQPETRRRGGHSAISWVRWLPTSLLVLMILAGAATWYWRAGAGNSTTVSVVAADNSAVSQRLARDLLVKLGQLQLNDAVAVTLIDELDQKGEADLRFSVSGTGGSPQPGASVTLQSSGEGAILWSKEFEQADQTLAGLEEQIGMASARVLGCVVEESAAPGQSLDKGTRRVFLNACASLAETGWDKRPVIPLLRQVVDRRPKFQPAWARLLLAQAEVKTLLESGAEPFDRVEAQLRADLEKARALNPDMAEILLAELALHPLWDFGKALEVLDEAKSNDPDNAAVLSARSNWLQSVGRMREAIADAELAARMDPLSPNVRSELIRTLAYGGIIDRARSELAAAKRLWPEAESVRETEYSIERRFGNYEKVIREVENHPAVPFYILARRDPSDPNVAAFIRSMEELRLEGPGAVFALQALGEMKRVDDFFALAARPILTKSISKDTYALFRPWVAPARRDPRFIQLAKRVGLVDYWRKSGEWPDFCSEPDLPYDCKAEAAKLG
jgi:tetratricopeptide (TPR) repeat protein